MLNNVYLTKVSNWNVCFSTEAQRRAGTKNDTLEPFFTRIISLLGLDIENFWQRRPSPLTTRGDL